jgi:hypothetical protein
MGRLPNRRNTRSTLASFLCAVALLVVVPWPAAAQAPGVRAGASVDPDQFYLGGHFETAPIVEQLHFKPNVEVGFGDNLTHVGINFEFVYKFPLEGPWLFYAGAGPAINFFSVDEVDDTFTEGGLNVLFGLETTRGLFFEVKLGALDSPDVKFGVGWTFR